MLVAPSLESSLFTEHLLRKWDDEAAQTEGLSAKRIRREGSRSRKLSLDNVLNGEIPTGGTVTQHYLKDQLALELGEVGFSMCSISKCLYDHTSEFECPPKWMKKDYVSRPWDWIAVAEKA